MKKYLLIVVGSILITFVTTMLHAQHSHTKSDTTWKNLYRATPERVHNLVHTKLDVSFNYEKAHLYGKAWITLTPHFYTTNKLILDAKGMDIHQVALVENGKMTKLNYQYTDKKRLHITLNKSYKKDEKYTVYIDYTAKPNEYATAVLGSSYSEDKGLYFINPLGKDKNKPTQIWTQGETDGSSVWFPTIDHPNQKTTQEISITVPKQYVTLSNGLLVAQKERKGGMRTDTWKMTLPHAPYLFFMAVGDYAIVKDKYKKIAVDYYVEKEYASVAKKIFGLTPEMLNFYSTKLGVEYPWEKYAQITARDFVSGAMENTTAVVHQNAAQQNERELLDGNRWEHTIAHELIHHWFGNLITAESWSNLSMNESFADYGEYLWTEYKYGKEKADTELAESMESYLSSGSFKKHLVRFYYKSPGQMFDRVSYNKGGIILHMLRNYLGDEAFFMGIKNFLLQYKFKAVEAHQLRLAFEEVSGKDLNWFFNQWFFSNGHPIIDISYDINDTKSTVTIQQIQKEAPIFRFPIYIDIYEADKKRRELVWVTEAQQTFSFNTASRPSLINVDADKILLCQKNDQKDLQSFIEQYNKANNFLDKKEAVAFALKNQEQKDAKMFLITQALKDKNKEIRKMVLYALHEASLSSQDFAIIEQIAQSDTDKKTKALAIEYLSNTQNAATYVPMYEAAVMDSSYSVAGAALAALIKNSPEKAFDYYPILKKDAKGKLAVAIRQLDFLIKDESNFDELYASYVAMPISSEKAENTFSFLEYLSRLKDPSLFKKGLDEVWRVTEKIAEDFPAYKDYVKGFLSQIQKNKKKANNEATTQDASIIIEYIQTKLD